MNNAKKIFVIAGLLIALAAIAFFVVKGSSAYAQDRPIIRRIELDPEDCKAPSSPGECFKEQECEDICAATEEECPSWKDRTTN